MVIAWPYTDRPPSVRTTGIPMFPLTVSSYSGSPGENWLHINVGINWQLSKQGICWPISLTVSRAQVSTHTGWVLFLKLSGNKLLVFKWSQAQVYYYFFKFILICWVYVTMAKHYYHFDFRLTSEAKIQPVISKYK